MLQQQYLYSRKLKFEHLTLDFWLRCNLRNHSTRTQKLIVYSKNGFKPTNNTIFKPSISINYIRKTKSESKYIFYSFYTNLFMFWLVKLKTVEGVSLNLNIKNNFIIFLMFMALMKKSFSVRNNQNNLDVRIGTFL